MKKLFAGISADTLALDVKSNLDTSDSETMLMLREKQEKLKILAETAANAYSLAFLKRGLTKILNNKVHQFPWHKHNILRFSRHPLLHPLIPYRHLHYFVSIF